MTHPRPLQKIQGDKIDPNQVLFKDFLVDFLNIWANIRILSSGYELELREVCKNVFDSFTKPFYEKWSLISPFKDHLEWYDNYAENYSSFILKVKNIQIAIPHKIVSLEYFDPKNLFQDLLSKAQSLNDFFLLLWKIFSDLNIQLTETDVRLLRAFTCREFFLTRSRFPSGSIIAEIASCGEKTYYRRVPRLYDAYVLSHGYFIDVGRLGYQTYCIMHNQIDGTSQFQREIDPFTLVDIPIDIGFELGGLKIIQFPSNNHTLYSAMHENFQPFISVDITKGYYSWNLTHLTPNPLERWKEFPPVFKETQWDTNILSPDIGISINYLPSLDPPKISYKQAQLLTYYQENSTTRDTQLVKMLCVSNNSISIFWQDILDEKLVIRFSTIENVGLDLKLWITLIGDQNSYHLNLVENILSHLKFFPNLRLFVSQKSQNKQIILTGIVQIPSSWVKKFSICWSLLEDLGFVPKWQIINDDKDLIRWNIDFINTSNFRG